VVDSHCHLADRAFSNDLAEVIDRARDAGLHSALCVVSAGDSAEAAQAKRVAEYWPEARFAVGVHPHQARQFAGRLGVLADSVREETSRTARLCALGEIGLDYHYDFSPRDLQRAVFAIQVQLARELRLPVVVHTREADADTLNVLRAEGAGEVRGVFHCFTGDQLLAEAALDLGFHVSLSGIVTFPNAGELRAVAAMVPLDRLLVETDCPYLAPVPFRGRRNEPAWVAQVIAAVAGVRGAQAGEIDDAAAKNFASLFGGEPREPSHGSPSLR
jgi:TatD DNase family protein